MQISKNFYLDEFITSQTAERLGIDNTPSDIIVKNLTALVDNILQPVRDHYDRPITISSGYRCPKLNKAIGGAVSSQHMKGEAADIHIPGVPNHELAQFIIDNFTFDQVILEFYTLGKPDSGWVHVAYSRTNPNKKSVLTAVLKDKKTVYLQGLVV